MEAIKRWLEQCQERWLLIFDNADEVALVRDYLPKLGNGSILLTTRAYAVGSLATSIEVETMGFLEGTQLLLRRAQRFGHATDEEVNQAGNIVVALDHFPLALDQAGAYIEETQCSFVDYLDLYQTHRQALLAQRGMLSTDYPHSVATTWLLSVQKVEQANPAAAELLHLCSFLAPDRIPEELLRGGAAYWPASLQQAVADPFIFQQLIAELLTFSLVKRLVEDHVLSIHRLVQAVQIDMMEPEVQRQWAERVIRAVNEVFPDNPQEVGTWPLCLRYLDQAQVCNMLIEQYTLPLIEAADLLSRTSLYLDEHALYTPAELLSQHALAICEQVLGPDHPDVATNLNNLASLYRGQGKYAEAESLIGRALAINEQALGPNHPEIAANLNNLASLYQSRGKYAEAEPLYQRALAIYEQQLGVEHPDTARSLHNLAGLYNIQGKYEQAEPLMQQALAIRRHHFEPDHPDIAQSLNNLAGLYVFQGKYEQAEPLFQEVLAIRKKMLGLNHPDTAQTLNNLAEVYRVQNKIEQAAPLCLEALVIRKQTLGLGHLDTAQSMHTLAMLYESQSEYEQAELLMQQVLKVYQEQLGSNHPDIAICLNDMSALYYAQGKYEQAELLIRRALAIQEQTQGPEHPSTALTQKNLSVLMRMKHPLSGDDNSTP